MFEVVEGTQGSITAAHLFDPAHKDGLEALAMHGDSLFTAARDCIKKWDLASKHIQGVSTWCKNKQICWVGVNTLDVFQNPVILPT